MLTIYHYTIMPVFFVFKNHGNWKQEIYLKKL